MTSDRPFTILETCREGPARFYVVIMEGDRIRQASDSMTEDKASARCKEWNDNYLLMRLRLATSAFRNASHVLSRLVTTFGLAREQYSN